MGDTPGINAKAVGVNGKRAAIIDMNATDPKVGQLINALRWLLRQMRLFMKCITVIFLSILLPVFSTKVNSWH